MGIPTIINTDEDVQQFLREVDGLHDAVLHEAALVTPAYVDDQGRMFNDLALPRARLIFQSQFLDVGALELNLKDISWFCFDATKAFKLEMQIDGTDKILYCTENKSRSVTSEPEP